MKSTTRICPGVITVVQIIQTSTIARDRANFPIEPAEMKRLRGRERDGSGALDNVHGNDRAARRRSHIHRRSWTIAWLHQKSCILKTQMGLGAPGRVRLNRNQGLRPRLSIRLV